MIGSMLASPASAQNRYVIHDDPWFAGAAINDNWDQAFGAAGYTHNSFAAASANFASIFSASTRMVWLEGGDESTTTFGNFLSTNLAAIESWVAAGGRLVLNAAPNLGGNVNLGFGGVLLNYDGMTTYSNNVTAADGSHAIFNGPFSPVGTSFSGTYFSHSFISGGGISSILDDEQTRSVLAEKNWGNGHVLFGGMTTDNFHSPNPEVQNLSANILVYSDTFSSSVVPEPSSVALMGLGLVGLAAGARRRVRGTAAKN